MTVVLHLPLLILHTNILARVESEPVKVEFCFSYKKWSLNFLRSLVVIVVLVYMPNFALLNGRDNQRRSGFLFIHSFIYYLKDYLLYSAKKAI